MRLGEEKRRKKEGKKIEITWQKYNGLPYYIGRPKLEMWANAQRDGRSAEYRWRPLFNAAKFG